MCSVLYWTRLQAVNLTVKSVRFPYQTLNSSRTIWKRSKEEQAYRTWTFPLPLSTMLCCAAMAWLECRVEASKGICFTCAILPMVYALLGPVVWSLSLQFEKNCLKRVVSPPAGITWICRHIKTQRSRSNKALTQDDNPFIT